MHNLKKDKGKDAPDGIGWLTIHLKEGFATKG
jgi:hypothetical protein